MQYLIKMAIWGWFLFRVWRLMLLPEYVAYNIRPQRKAWRVVFSEMPSFNWCYIQLQRYRPVNLKRHHFAPCYQGRQYCVTWWALSLEWAGPALNPHSFKNPGSRPFIICHTFQPSMLGSKDIDLQTNQSSVKIMENEHVSAFSRFCSNK